ncbi:MAG: AbrB family transcriptional regulator [Xanthobacteraceae bacterium]|nr:AbrB family transcriptional regulator [Xanthobacteraceae bacterium]
MAESSRDQKSDAPALPVRRIGDDLGLILPNAVLGRLKLRAGDKLHVVELTARGMSLSRYSPKHGKAMEIAKRAMRKYANTFQSLAK